MAGGEEHDQPVGGRAVQEGQRRGIEPKAAHGGRNREEVGRVRAHAVEGDELLATDGVEAFWPVSQ